MIYANVRLTSISQPVVEDMTTPEQLLAYYARVSSTANQLNHATGPKLIRSLIKRKEWSPLEMVHATMEIETTRDIGRQILRHRSFSFQEFSQRYAKVETDKVNIVREARLQDKKDRQNSIETDDVDLEKEWEEVQMSVSFHASEAYEWALDNGIAKEQARAVLPEGLTPTKMYMAGTLRSWYHYHDLRHMKGTQKEHRVVAEKSWDELVRFVPSLKTYEEPENHHENKDQLSIFDRIVLLWK